ncbi:unnamed protein product [Cochlearia groenlandica]
MGMEPLRLPNGCAIKKVQPSRHNCLSNESSIVWNNKVSLLLLKEALLLLHKVRDHHLQYTFFNLWASARWREVGRREGYGPDHSGNSSGGGKRRDCGRMMLQKDDGYSSSDDNDDRYGRREGYGPDRSGNSFGGGKRIDCGRMMMQKDDGYNSNDDRYGRREGYGLDRSRNN